MTWLRPLRAEQVIGHVYEPYVKQAKHGQRGGNYLDLAAGRRVPQNQILIAVRIASQVHQMPKAVLPKAVT